MSRSLLLTGMLLLPLTTAARAQALGGGLFVDCNQVATSFETGPNRCNGVIETRRCCEFTFKVTNLTPNPVDRFWLEVEAGDGAVICYDHGAPFGTDDISISGCVPSMCYTWDCKGYMALPGQNRGVVQVDCLFAIPPGGSVAGKLNVDAATGPILAVHPPPTGCIQVHATMNPPTSVNAVCSDGSFSAHASAFQSQFWTPASVWCCCESNPVTYCTAGKSSSSCQAMISAHGTSSATASSGFVLRAADVQGSSAGTSGLFFYGVNGRQANPWGNPSAGCTSFQCVRPPTRRGALQNGGGSSGNCNAFFQEDLNARWTFKPAHNPGAGATLQGQLWYRDPNNPCTGAMAQSTTAMSNAVEWTVCP
jgi:hypothetical protein